MSDVEFEEDTFNTEHYGSRSILGKTEMPSMMNALMKTKVIKSPKAAHYVLLGIVIFCIVVSLYILIFMRGGSSTASRALQDQIMEESLLKIKRPIAQ